MNNKMIIALIAATALFVLAVAAQTRNQKTLQEPTADNVLKTAQKAFQNYDRGASGDWSALLEMLTDDVAVRLPLPPNASLGAKTGKERAKAIYDFVANVQKVRCKLTPTALPLVNGNRVAFEYISAGKLDGNK